MSTKVKVCGITNLEDALTALELGADALGFNFHPQSPRYLTPAEAAKITSRIPPFACSVGLFVNVGDTSEVERMARSAGTRVLQLHGTESDEFVRKLRSGWTVIKAFPVGEGEDGKRIRECPAQGILLDTADRRLHGGTGKTFDWTLCRKLEISRPLILAGGLHSGNVASAIRSVRPYAVDVCSGVESAPGKKDRSKMAEFMREVRHVDE